MTKNTERKKRVLNRVSNVSIAMILFMIISKRFLRQYMEPVMDVIFLLGFIACISFIATEFMKFKLKKKEKIVP